MKKKAAELLRAVAAAMKGPEMYPQSIACAADIPDGPTPESIARALAANAKEREEATRASGGKLRFDTDGRPYLVEDDDQ